LIQVYSFGTTKLIEGKEAKKEHSELRLGDLSSESEEADA
jgi:hypothetical protein